MTSQVLPFALRGIGSKDFQALSHDFEKVYLSYISVVVLRYLVLILHLKDH